MNEEQEVSRPELEQVDVVESESELELGPIDFNTPEGQKRFYDFKKRKR